MNENNHPINDLMQTTMAKIREMVDANTVVGQPIATQDGVTLIPVSRLSFGFASGGSDFGGKAQQADKNFGGGAGAGVSVVPVAFLVVKEGQVKLIPMGPPAADTASRVVELVPEMFDKVTDYLDKRTRIRTNFEGTLLPSECRMGVDPFCVESVYGCGRRHFCRLSVCLWGRCLPPPHRLF